MVPFDATITVIMFMLVYNRIRHRVVVMKSGCILLALGTYGCGSRQSPLLLIIRAVDLVCWLSMYQLMVIEMALLRRLL